jgi:aspartate-semialdehyde dehydrogenase
MKLALVGATGLVGNEMIKVLEERLSDKISEFIPVASEKSVGKSIKFNGKDYSIKTIENAIESNCDVAIFSAGGSVSLEWAAKFEAKNCFVVDNSSAWRMNTNNALVVPEINPESILSKSKIIANPNCSTIQLVMILAPLHKRYKIKRVVVSTYQSITGTGVNAVNQMESERMNDYSKKVYPYVIDKNCIPQCDVFSDDDYTKEELKIINETKKILNDDSIRITSTAVRVPVVGGHSESVNIEFEEAFDIQEVKNILNKTKGVIVNDDIANLEYPMPINAKGKDEVFVGRIRRDLSTDNALNLWIVADNLRKGAATNAVQIVEYLLSRGLVK